LNSISPTLLFLSPTPVFDLPGNSGKEVVSLSLKTLSQHFLIVLIAPGTDPKMNNLHFHRIRSSWFQRMKSIPLLGHLFNYFYFIYVWLSVNQIVKQQKVKPDVIYMAGPWMSLIGHHLRSKTRNNALLVNRYYGTSIPLNYPKNLRNKLRYALKLAGYRKIGDLVIMTNDGTRGKEFLQNLGCPPERIRFWTNGVHFPQSPVSREQARMQLQSKWGIDSSEKILLTVSRLAKWKRVERAIWFLYFAIDQKIHRNTTLIIAGDGEQRSQLQKEAIGLGVHKKVIFAGSLTRKELDWLYPASDVFISLYDHSNAGNPLFESMVHGCCIFTFGSAEVREYLDDESAELTSLSALNTDALNQLLGEPEKRLRLGQEARKRALVKLKTWDERMQMESEEILQALEEKKTIKT
jgi:glycosyltransferase involved in cell wall biosynthesis